MPLTKSNKVLSCLVSLCFLASPACNYPGLAQPAAGLPAEELHQTLEAQSRPTDQELIATEEGVQTPAPNPFAGLSTATPLGASGIGPPHGAPAVFEYLAQSGDTLPAIAGRFGVQPGQVLSSQPLPGQELIPPGQRLQIPNVIGENHYTGAILPDSEVIYSPSAVDFDLPAYITQAGGYLSTYVEQFDGETLSGEEIVQRVAVESSVNPRFLLAALEYQSGWVLGAPKDVAARNFPLGFAISGQDGLYRELVMTATHLQLGYYGWRSGRVTELKFRDGTLARISPVLNSGSVGVQVLFSKLYKQDGWIQALYGPDSFPILYQRMFGDPWVRGAAYEPLFPVGAAQPSLELPFAPGQRWSLTGGPHEAWKTGSPRGALDLAPVTGESACAVSRRWITAPAAGLVVRSERNVVSIDLDGDGFEQTGWVIVFLHVADKDRLSAGVFVTVDENIGHPSCEGGRSTGTHVHITRKYNGEWIAADGPLPLVLSGWRAYAWEKNYQGELRRGDLSAVASPVGPRSSIITR